MTVLVRASKPGLADFGVTGTLATPQIKLLDAKINVVATNAV